MSDATVDISKYYACEHCGTPIKITGDSLRCPNCSAPQNLKRVKAYIVLNCDEEFQRELHHGIKKVLMYGGLSAGMLIASSVLIILIGAFIFRAATIPVAANTNTENVAPATETPSTNDTKNTLPPSDKSVAMGKVENMVLDTMGSPIIKIFMMLLILGAGAMFIFNKDSEDMKRNMMVIIVAGVLIFGSVTVISLIRGVSPLDVQGMLGSNTEKSVPFK